MPIGGEWRETVMQPTLFCPAQSRHDVKYCGEMLDRTLAGRDISRMREEHSER